MKIKGSEPFAAANVIDSRDLVARVDYLENLAVYDMDSGEYYVTDDGMDDDERDELAMLRDALDEIGSEAVSGVTLIADGYFEKYAQEYAEEIGAISSDASWPLTYIDWEAAANDLQADDTSVEIDGDTYWYR